ncbi:hypothetical protein F4801DRAFT_546075 [Xylaria longipes]|nr:hypothetical protein F4801DRAFT_546075 [Xylaria longipes]
MASTMRAPGSTTPASVCCASFSAFTAKTPPPASKSPRRPASHPMVSLMLSVARMSRYNPSATKQTFRNAYRAAAESLEEAQAISRREADVTTCLLHSPVFFLFYCVGDYAQARKVLSDLPERTARRIAA